MFLFSLFHLEGYRIRLNNHSVNVSGMLRYFESQQSSTFRGLKASPRFSLVAKNSARWPYA